MESVDENLIELTLEGGRFPDDPEAAEGTSVYAPVGKIRRLIPMLGDLCDVAELGDGLLPR